MTARAWRSQRNHNIEFSLLQERMILIIRRLYIRWTDEKVKWLRRQEKKNVIRSKINEDVFKVSKRVYTITKHKSDFRTLWSIIPVK